jgi:hypothetical protein
LQLKGLQVLGIGAVKALLFMLIHDVTPQWMENEESCTPCGVQSLLWDTKSQGWLALPHTRNRLENINE